jgi:hypothetical protein
MELRYSRNKETMNKNQYVKPTLHKVMVNGMEDFLTDVVVGSDMDGSANAKPRGSFVVSESKESRWGDLWGTGEDPHNTAR